MSVIVNSNRKFISTSNMLNGRLYIMQNRSSAYDIDGKVCQAFSLDGRRIILFLDNTTMLEIKQLDENYKVSLLESGTTLTIE